MVYWLLSAFVGANLQVLVEKLADLGINTINSTIRSDNKLGRLLNTLAKLQSSIHDTEDTQMVTGHPWQTLLSDFEEVRYYVEELLNEFVTEVPELEGGSLKRSHHLSEQTMEGVQEKLDDMLKELDRLQRKSVDMTLTKRQTTSFVKKSRVFGRDTDIANFLRMLQPPEASSKAGNVSVIPIHGVIGVGKTTLAQLAYNHDYGDHDPFHIKIWVSVPVNFDITSLTKSIIEEANRQSGSMVVNSEPLSELESLQQQLAGILRGKKFMLVLDDLWNVKRVEWSHLLKPLNQGKQGSKIIVTTGSRVVSNMVATAGNYELKCLSSEDCWKMLKQEALGEVNAKVDPQLETIGLEIAKKCDGLPLAAKIFGGQLPSSDNMPDWKNILESKVWNLPAIKSEVSLALQWGFRRLPLRLRQCSAYCSMFPESYEFEQHKIIRMWMGAGLIVFDEDRNVPEDIGRYYIDQLLENSFFGKYREKYKLQSSVHKLVQSVSSNKFLKMEEASATRTNESTQHLSLHCDNIETAFPNVCKCKGLRSLILFIKAPFDSAPLAMLGLERLRVLDFSGTQIKDLTESIGNLIHLRFLDLSNTRVKLLPETIKELRALQTLVLTNSPDLLRLPDSTCKLINLLHLQLGGNDRLSSMPSGIGKLIGLRAIDEFIIGSKKGQINELKNLNNIRGSLCIKQLENVDTLGDLDPSLAEKKNLDSLELQWSSVDDEHKCELVLGKLKGPVNLKQIFFRRYGGTMFPQWVSKPSYTKLEGICFQDCENCELLPTLGKLPKLKSLIISGMHKLKAWNEQFIDEVPVFPSLETLKLHDVPVLEEWTGLRKNDMACLRRLAIGDCPQLVSIPSLHHFQYLENLKFEDCPMLPLFTEEVLSRSVKFLSIENCSLLENRYKEGNDDRMKIAHIPIIEV